MNRQRRIAPTEHLYRRIWKSKAFVALLCVTLVLMLISVTKETLRGIETRYEIERLEKEYVRLEQRNTELQDVIALLNTSVFQDKQARVKLGLRAEGEQVVVFQDQRRQTEIILPDNDTTEYIPVNDFQSNPEKWIHFFWNRIQLPQTD